MKNADAVIIGSGQAGKPLALQLAKIGWKVILIEKTEEKLGGVCLNEGCTPTKTLIASAKIAHDLKTGEKHGISIGDFNINFNKTQDRKNKVVLDSRNSLENRIDKVENLELLFGEASFLDQKTISLKKEDGTEDQIPAKYIFINAGCRPSIPKIKGLEDIDYDDSKSILELKSIPEKLIVLGGSYIGLELGQMYSRFGSDVSIIERSEQLMPKEDNDVAQSIFDTLKKEGIDVLLSTETKSVRKSNGKIKVEIEQAGKISEIEGTHFLVATGREPVSDELNLSAAGIETDKKGFVKVNEFLETNIKNIYALGDINGGPQFTHIAYDDFRIVFNNLTQDKNISTKDRIIPYCMFTDPQLGRVGISEQEAKEKNLKIEVISIPGKRITRGIEKGSVEGIWKAVIDQHSRKILGAAIVCSEGGEVITILQMAMQGGITAEKIRDGTFAHPTYAESLNTLFMEMK